jgi:preprotein translocase subunit SecG
LVPLSGDSQNMDTFVAVIHVITALVLIALVLVQDSKGGGGLGGAMGGGSNSIMGATGAATLAQKMTRIAAVVFAATSISMTVLSRQTNSVVDNLVAPPAAATATETAADATPAADVPAETATPAEPSK